MTDTVLAPGDVSTSASDFQADGTAAAGSTGRVADAGHVHPSGGGSSLGYEVVSQTYATDGSANFPTGPFTVDAPEGKSVVGGGYVLGFGTDGGNNYQVLIGMYVQAGASKYYPLLFQNAPASDGSSWKVDAQLSYMQGTFGVPPDQSGSDNSYVAPPASTTVITVYAICMDS